MHENTNNIWMGYLIQIIVLVIFFLSLLACRTYCIKRKRHKIGQIIARVNASREQPRNQTNPAIIIQCSCAMSNQHPPTSNETEDYLPGANLPNSAQPSISTQRETREQDLDQISLESHVIYDSQGNVPKTPPPPYYIDYLPTYEEAIRWSNNSNTTNRP